MQVKKGGGKKNPRFEDWTSGKNYGKIKKKEPVSEDFGEDKPALWT